MPWLQTSFLLLAFATCIFAEGPEYELRVDIGADLDADSTNAADVLDIFPSGGLPISSEVNYEWESYDGWYNNPAHVEWGGYGECVRTVTACHACRNITSPLQLQL